MFLKDKIQENLKSALKEKKEIELSTLRLLTAAIFNKEKEKRYKLSKEKPGINIEALDKESPEAKELDKESSLADDEVLEAISSEIKKRKEALSLFEKGKRDDLVEKEKAEMEILKKYLPEQMGVEELKKIAKAAIEKVGAKEMRDFGKVMTELMPQVKGRADGNMVSKIVRELLTQ